jgi:DNA-directed RNA polymerase specialized sigma24 family protein
VKEEGRVRNEIERLVPALRRFARALAGRDADHTEIADDLVRETVHRVLRSERHPRSQNAGIAAFATLVAVHRHRPKPRTAAPAASQSATAAPESAASGPGHRSTGVTEALAAVPLEGREALLLVVLAEFSYAEAADILAVSKHTLAQRIFRARAVLDEQMFGAVPETHPGAKPPHPHLRLVK